MPWTKLLGSGLIVGLGISVLVGESRGQAPVTAADDPIGTLVAHLDLERYKATIKGLTEFGDRLQGTDRNRAAIDWIEAQLRNYGCTNTERLSYVWNPPPPRPRP